MSEPVRVVLLTYLLEFCLEQEKGVETREMAGIGLYDKTQREFF